MNQRDYPVLTFSQPFDERIAYEVEQKGWCGIGVVELPDGSRVEVFFMILVAYLAIWNILKKMANRVQRNLA